MDPLIEDQRRHIEALEAWLFNLMARNEKLKARNETLKARVWDLEEQLYRNSRVDEVRARFDEESG